MSPREGRADQSDGGGGWGYLSVEVEEKERKVVIVIVIWVGGTLSSGRGRRTPQVLYCTLCSYR